MDDKKDEEKEKVEKDLIVDPVCGAGVVEVEKKKEDKEKVDPYKWDG